jgi:hypothetical protein
MPSKAKDKTVHSFNITHRWDKIMAVGCGHGELANKAIQQQVLDFAERFKPKYRFELGDVMDTAAFRSGARGTKDESREVSGDQLAAVTWLKRYHPTHVAWGNHDVRLLEWMESPNAVVAHAAGCVWNELQTTVNKLKAKTVPYDYEKGWFEMGGVCFGHGYWFNENAVRDHAEFLGKSCVIAHLHRPQCLQGRTRNFTQSFCVGTLSDIDKMVYARRRRATGAWGSGCVYGYVSGDKSRLWLSSAPKGEELIFPL